MSKDLIVAVVVVAVVGLLHTRLIGQCMYWYIDKLITTFQKKITVLFVFCCVHAIRGNNITSLKCIFNIKNIIEMNLRRKKKQNKNKEKIERQRKRNNYEEYRLRNSFSCIPFTFVILILVYTIRSLRMPEFPEQKKKHTNRRIKWKCSVPNANGWRETEIRILYNAIAKINPSFRLILFFIGINKHSRVPKLCSHRRREL